MSETSNIDNQETPDSQPMGWLTRYQQYLSEFVYGGIDGSVTTFAVVAGSAGANLDSSIIIILGFANLIADGFSMSVGSYLSNKSDIENFEKQKKLEQQRIEQYPEQGKEEIRQIFRSKGFDGEHLEKITRVITTDQDLWINTMMKEKLEMTKQSKSPFAMGLVTFISFIFVGLIPLLIYVLDYISEAEMSTLFTTSIILTSLAFLGIGFLKSVVNETGKLRSIGETLFLGSAAAVLAYVTGNFLEHLF